MRHAQEMDPNAVTEQIAVDPSGVLGLVYVMLSIHMALMLSIHVALYIRLLHRLEKQSMRHHVDEPLAGPASHCCCGCSPA
mmetsp:Transcript_82467/g.145530  ORF Transcript_82467/g.145530 Transcript_82467/m.145530 type:complete len:81 (+) Transcript_82467:766-1008(+)